MSDFDPNVAASIAAENTFQASQERPAAIVSRSDVIAAAIDVATNEGLDDDWECVRASDLDRLRVALGLTTGDRDVPE